MARGFWKGLVHGAVISVAGLAVLSLLAPLFEKKAEGDVSPPELTNPAFEGPTISVDDAVDEVAATPEVLAEDSLDSADVEDQPEAGVVDTPAPEAEISEPTEPNGASDDSADSVGGPQAAAVNLPVGSEFGRGGDVVPVLPAPMVSDMQSRQTDAPAVSAPTAEPAPVAITDPGTQPAADLPDVSLPQSESPQGEDTPNPDMPAALETPQSPQTPGFVGADDRDSLPAVAPEGFEEPASEEALEETRQHPESVTQAEPVENNAPAEGSANTPAMPSPELDLSTPPDLSELRGLQN